MNDMQRRVNALESRFDRMDDRMTALSTEHVRTDAAFQEFRKALETRMEDLEESMEKHLQGLTTKLDSMAHSLSGAPLLEKAKLIGEVFILLVALWAILHGQAPPK